KFVCICTHDNTKQEGFVYKESGDLSGGMQHNTEPNKNTKEIKALGDAIDESELKKHLEENNGNVVLVIERLTSKLMHRERYIFFFTFLIQTINYRDTVYVLFFKEKKYSKKAEKIKKDADNENVREIKLGINFQGYCNNKKYHIECPNCVEKTVMTLIKVMFYNSDYSIHVIGDLNTLESNNYQSKKNETQVLRI
ncbi:hypothetical protein RFI_34850, partial [Reticulomyxa filosa]